MPEPQFFFTADTHFNHRGIMHHASRPFRTVSEMNAELVRRWNAVVRLESDVVYHLGDFGMHAPSDGEAEDLGVLFWRLRGRKHLVVGNHDKKNQQVLRLPWESIELIDEVKRHGRRLVLCHYAIENWPGQWRGAAHLHGHSHGTLGHKIAKRFDVGVDGHWPGLAPVAWDEVWTAADAETFAPVDHHGKGE